MSNIVESDCSIVERLWRSEVIHNIIILGILQHSELVQLVRGDLDRLEEVDPVDNLHTARSGQRARVTAVSCRR